MVKKVWDQVIAIAAEKFNSPTEMLSLSQGKIWINNKSNSVSIKEIIIKCRSKGILTMGHGSSGYHPGGRTPLLSAQELEKLGYDLVIFPTASTYMVAQAMKNLMEELMKTGTTENLIPEMIPFPEFNELIGLAEIRKLEAKFVIG